MITVTENLQSLENLKFDNDVHYLKIDKSEVAELMLYLKEHLGMVSLLDIFVEDRFLLGTSNRFLINYLLKNLDLNKSICVQFEFDENFELSSQSYIWPNALVWEQEISQLYGLDFSFQNFKNSLQIYDVMRKDFEVKNIENKSLESLEKFNLSLAPSHYLYSSDLEVKLSLNDDEIQDCFINRGFQYRGIEKNCENLTIEQLIAYSSKWVSDKAIFYNVLCCDSLEKLLSVELPERAMAIRMILLELNRIMDHCLSLAMISYEKEHINNYLLMMSFVEKVKSLILFYNHGHMSTSFCCIGGVNNDIPQGWVPTCISVLDLIEQGIIDINKTLTGSNIWNTNLRVGTISSASCLEYSVTGPTLRASGVNYDLRKKAPKYFYKDVDFDTPIGQEGMVLDRFLIRVEEIYQSIRIIMQVLDNLPSGEVISNNSIALRNLKTNDDLFRERVNTGINIPKKQTFNSIESSNGEIGLHLVGQDSIKLSRLKIFSSSNNALQLFSSVIIGQDYHESITVFTSLGINMKEVER